MRLRDRTQMPALAVAVLAVLALAGGAPAAGQGTQGAKVGIIDVQKILTESTRGQAVIAELEKFRDQKASDLQAFKTKFDDAQKRLSDGRLTLSDDKLKELEKEIEDLTIEIRRAQDDAQRQLQQRQQEDFQKIEEAVMPIINQVGKEYGFTVIFNKFQSGLVFADETVDITGMVIERFNAGAGSGN